MHFPLTLEFYLTSFAYLQNMKHETDQKTCFQSCDPTLS